MDNKPNNIGLNAMLAARLVNHLKTHQFPMEAAVFVYFPDIDQYRFVIVTKKVDEIGVRDTYKEIVHIIHENEGSYRPYGGWVKPVGPSDSEAKAIKAGGYEGLNYAELDTE